MADTHKPSRPNKDAEKKSPNYRTRQAPRAKNGIDPNATRDCQPVNPPAAPGSAAENHEAANQICTVNPPETASKDHREKATG